MNITNKEIAEILYQYADLLEASSTNLYRVRAYRRAAKRVLYWQDEISVLIKNNFDLTIIPFVGKGISYTIREIVRTKRAPIVRPPPNNKKTVNELIGIRGLGKQRIKILNEECDIRTRKELLTALETDQLKHITWLSEKFVNQIITELKNPPKSSKFLRLYHAIPIVELLLNRLKTLPNVNQVECVGGFRRKTEIVEDLIFIIDSSEEEEVMQRFIQFNEVATVLYREPHLLIVNLAIGIQASLRFVSHTEFPYTVFFHTGNEQHVNEISNMLKQRSENELRCQNEYDIYEQLNLEFIEPELRENHGEIVAAKDFALPTLITLHDIKGDLHSHTNETDGHESLETMVQAAMQKGYQYCAITDHSKRLVITNGMDEKRLLNQIQQIDALNAKLKNFIILKSIEVDILEDGSLDLSNDVLKELDIVVCSIHSKFKMDEKTQTDRILRAMDNPYFNILGHATGRLIKSREPYSINIEKILQAAKDHNCFIELNAQPYRLDIKDVYCQMAKEKGVKIAISSDAHSPREFNFMQLGVFQARRGWLEKSDVINTRTWPELKKLLKRS